MSSASRVPLSSSPSLSHEIRPCLYGQGAFALRALHPGEIILRFEGPEISLEQAASRGEREAYPLQIGPRVYLDIVPPGNLVNHSCSPNAGIHWQDRGPILVARRVIQPGVEITYDYSTTMDEDHWQMRNCRCGQQICRGTIGDFKTLPEVTQQLYLKEGIVMPFIAAQFAAQRQ